MWAIVIQEWLGVFSIDENEITMRVFILRGGISKEVQRLILITRALSSTPNVYISFHIGLTSKLGHEFVPKQKHLQSINNDHKYQYMQVWIQNTSR